MFHARKYATHRTTRQSRELQDRAEREGVTEVG